VRYSNQRGADNPEENKGEVKGERHALAIGDFGPESHLLRQFVKLVVIHQCVPSNAAVISLTRELNLWVLPSRINKSLYLSAIFQATRYAVVQTGFS